LSRRGWEGAFGDLLFGLVVLLLVVLLFRG
jgi:hypothetical protein